MFFRRPLGKQTTLPKVLDPLVRPWSPLKSPVVTTELLSTATLSQPYIELGTQKVLHKPCGPDWKSRPQRPTPCYSLVLWIWVFSMWGVFECLGVSFFFLVTFYNKWRLQISLNKRCLWSRVGRTWPQWVPCPLTANDLFCYKLNAEERTLGA